MKIHSYHIHHYHHSTHHLLFEGLFIQYISTWLNGKLHEDREHVYFYHCILSISHSSWYIVPRVCSVTVWLSPTLWTVTCQDPLSMEFFGKNTGAGCHSLLQEIFPTQGWNQIFCASRIADKFFITAPPRKPLDMVDTLNIYWMNESREIFGDLGSVK